MKIGNLELEWTGHSGFFIYNSKRIYIDPYQLSPGKEKADIILITHSHYDHCSIEDLRKIVKDGTIVVCSADCQSKITKLDGKLEIRNLEPGQETTIDKIRVQAIPAYNINKEFHTKQDYWNGYVIDIEGIRIYHAGDSDFVPEMTQLERIDAALLPVGGLYTMNAEEAGKAVFMIKPKLAIPMHYGTISGNRENALRFKDLCEQEGINCEILEKI